MQFVLRFLFRFVLIKCSVTEAQVHQNKLRIKELKIQKTTGLGLSNCPWKKIGVLKGSMALPEDK